MEILFQNWNLKSAVQEFHGIIFQSNKNFNNETILPKVLECKATNDNNTNFLTNYEFKASKGFLTHVVRNFTI